MSGLPVIIASILVVVSRELFEFGPEVGDKFTKQADDVCTSSITLTHSVNFFGRQYSKLYVCNNGIISFGDPITSYIPQTFLLREKVLISPLWSDVDVRDFLTSYRNNVFYRQTTDAATLKTIQKYLEERLDSSEKAVWTMIITWYYVAAYQPQVDAYNTFQAVLVSLGSSQQRQRLIVIFIYDSIQWTMTGSQQVHAQAGYNDGEGNYYMLPGSRLPEVRNLQSTSNVGDPGSWIFVLNNGETCTRFVTTISPVDSSLIGGGKFNISGMCNITNHDSVQVRFTGSRRAFSVQANWTGGVIQARFPYWGRSEDVMAQLLVNHQTKASFNVRFYSQLEKFRFQENELPMVWIVRRKENGYQVIYAKWNATQLTKNGQGHVEMKVVKIKEMYNISREEADLSFELITKMSVPNNGSAEIQTPSGDYDSLHVGVMEYDCRINEYGFGFHSSSCGKTLFTDAIPSYRPSNQAAACKKWLKEEDTRGKDWHKEVEKWYACPRSPPARAETDAWFARAEVDRGFRGWQNDECCMESPPLYMKTLQVCDNCRRNPGAKFCIRSIMLRMLDNSGSAYDASNKCCYDSSERLITEVSKGAGTVHRGFSRFGIESYENDGKPYDDCCSSSDDLCRQYHEFRPALKGQYVAPASRILFGDPHWETLDGVKFTFNGFGVYQLLLSGNDSLDVQVSTRVKGRGTVFSGISVTRENTSAEVFLFKNGDLRIMINEVVVDPHRFLVNVVDKVMVFAKDNSTEFVLIFEDGLAVNAIVITGILNFGVSVPQQYKGSLVGLMGNFDDDPDNDFMSRSGEALPVSLADTDEGTAELHESLGESWRVARSDWSFSVSAADAIESELSRDPNYSAVYVTQFESELIREQAEQACSETEEVSACLLDVALTRDLSLARVSREISPYLEAKDALNEVYSICQYPTEEGSGTIRVDQNILLSAFVCIFYSFYIASV